MYKLILIGSLLLSWNGTTQTENQETLSYVESTPDTVNCCNIVTVTPGAYDGELDVKTIAYVQEDEEVKLSDFSQYYLPKNFDPYVGSIDEIEYVDEEEEVTMGFDTKKYLPVAFNAKVLSLDEIAYVDLDEDEVVEMGFNTEDYLPKGFDAYVGRLDSLKYVNLNDEQIFGLDINSSVTRL